jgi:hypothetical protein
MESFPEEGKRDRRTGPKGRERLHAPPRKAEKRACGPRGPRGRLAVGLWAEACGRKKPQKGWGLSPVV